MTVTRADTNPRSSTGFPPARSLLIGWARLTRRPASIRASSLCDRASARNMRAPVTRVQPGPDHRETGVLPSHCAGLLAADRAGATHRGRLRRYRPQRMGHPQCAGNRGGHGGAYRRWRRTHRRSGPVRSRPSSAVRPGGTAARLIASLLSRGQVRTWDETGRVRIRMRRSCLNHCPRKPVQVRR